MPRIRTTLMTLALSLAAAVADAGDDTAASAAPRLVHPISTPVLNDTALPKNQVTVIYFYHRLPGDVSTIIGDVPLDGEVQAVAVQVEWALSERWSLTAYKDGYIWFDPDQTLAEEEGIADVAAGLKYLLYHENGLALALRAGVEIPVGDRDVFQGNGDGTFIPSVLATWYRGPWQLNAVAGLEVPFDGDEESLRSHLLLGGSYTVAERLSLLLELNWLRVLDAGDGDADFGGSQGHGLVPAVVDFDGPQEFNLGALNAEDEADIVSLGLGLRYQLCDWANLGVGWEAPLTDNEAALTDDRFYLNLAIHF